MESTAFPSIADVAPPSPYALVTVIAGQQVDALTLAVRNAFQDAMALQGALCDAAYRVHGFSGRKFRLLMNNLMFELADPRYLEIGLFHGASFCSAIYQNELRAVGIDNWTEYDGQRSLFDENLASFMSAETDVEILETDFRKVNYRELGPFNVLFYDGSHAEIDQYDGVFLPNEAMDDSYILIVDDWNWDPVRRGTHNALKDAGVAIDYSIEIRTSFDGGLPPIRGATSEWHNGALIAVVSKTGR